MGTMLSVCTSVTTYQEQNCFREIVLKFVIGVPYKKFIGKCEFR